MKPYSTQPYSRKATQYTIGISGSRDLIDQKRKTIFIRPGIQTTIKVIPRIVETSMEYHGLQINERRCKLPHETDGLDLLSSYSRKGCETECAIKSAMSICKCIPWHYPNDFHKWPMCELFGAYCFDVIMSHDTHYWGCKYKCLKDCDEVEYIVLPEYFPIDLNKACFEKSFLGVHFKRYFRKHFAFQTYKTLVEEGSIPDLATSYDNGSLCKDYVTSYVAFVSVDSPTKKVILTKRDKSVFFYDKLGIVGGTFGLFVGMSLISFAEVAILLIEIFYQFYRYGKNPMEFVDEVSSWFNNKDKCYNKKMNKLDNDIKVSSLLIIAI